MKKKLTKFAALAVAHFCFLFPACSQTDGTVTVSVNGFESYDEVRMTMPLGFVGALDINREGKYITQGDASMKVVLERTSGLATRAWLTASAEGGAYISDNVNARLSFYPKHEYNQLQKVKSFSVDIYNANEYDAEAIFFATDVNGAVMYSCMRTLRKSQMNELCFPLNGLFYADAMTLVNKYNIAFVGEGKDEVYYVDNFNVQLRGDQTDDSVQKSDAWSFLNFNDIADMKYVNQVSYTEMPVVKAYYNADRRFSQTGGSLCLEMLPFTGTEALRSNARQQAMKKGCGVELHPGVLAQDVVFAEKFLLDVYVDSTQSKILHVSVSDDKTTKTVDYTVVGGKWQTLTFACNEINPLNLTKFVVTVDTSENSERTKIYLEDISYE